MTARRLAITILAAVRLLLWQAVPAAAQSLPECHTGTAHERWQMKTRALDHFLATSIDAATLITEAVPTGDRLSNDPVAPFERQVWTVPRAYVWLVKQSADDCDLHLEISATPSATAPRFIAEIPRRDLDAQRDALTRLHVARLGAAPHRFAAPVAVSVTGWGFVDLDHACHADAHRGCSHGSAHVATLLELHPATLGPAQ